MQLHGLPPDLLVSSVLLGLLAVQTAVNLVLFRSPRRPTPDPVPLPRIDAIVPARDEAPRIGACVATLLAQEGVDLRVVVVDDGSSDGTADAARAAGAGDPRLRVVPADALPPGWSGKNHACDAGTRALGERAPLLFFTDADVRFERDALAAAAAGLETTGASLYSLAPRQETRTLLERLAVPAVCFSPLVYGSLLLIPRRNLAVISAANGQFLLFRREAYEAIGGHAGAPAEIVEDIRFAQRVKRSGRRVVIADGSRLVTCRMYDSNRAVVEGFSKNLYPAVGNGAVLVFGAALLVLTEILPFVRLFWPGIAAVLGIHAAVALRVRRNPLEALLSPFAAAVLLYLSIRSYRRSGTVLWKGRAV